MDPENPDSQRSVFLERFRSYFSRDTQLRPAEEPPPRVTFAIVVCVIISGILWLTFTMQETHEIVVPLEVQLQNRPEDRALEDSLPKFVRVTVQGQRIQLLRTLWDPPTVPINLDTERVIVEEQIVGLRNVRVLSVSPTAIEPRLGRMVHRRVPVQMRHRITMPSTHDFLVPPTPTPDSVVVTGALSVVERIRSWPTSVVARENLKDTLSVAVPLSDSLSSLIQLQPREVRVMAVVGQFTGAVREIDVHVQGAPSNVVLEPAVVSVSYTVLLSQYDQALRAPDFFAEVSYDQIREDQTGYVRPVLNPPEGLEVRNVEMIPSRVGYFYVE